jgi:hypothetical protein
MCTVIGAGFFKTGMFRRGKGTVLAQLRTSNDTRKVPLCSSQSKSSISMVQNQFVSDFRCHFLNGADSQVLMRSEHDKFG